MTTIFEDILGRETWGERPALLGDGGCSYGEFIASCHELACRIKESTSAGAVIAACLPPSFGYAVILLASYVAQRPLVPINPSASGDERKEILENAGAELLIVETGDGKTSATTRSEIWRDLSLFRLSPLDTVRPAADDRYLIYTSGSTSKPKAAILSDLAISSNVRAIADDLALSPGDRSIVFTPTGYTYAMSQTLTHLWAGGSMVQWRHGLMYPAAILRAIEELRLTGLAANPTFMRMFLSLKLSRPVDAPAVRYVKSAGQPLYSNLAKGMVRLFPQARILCTYGCTENSPRICHHWLPVELPDRDTAWSVGWPLRGTEIKLASAQGEPVAAGQPGEIFIRGSSLMRGYWREPALTAERMLDGWFRTGDIGINDAEGGLSIVGRADNVIGVGHEKVAPEEVEAVIVKVTGVVDAAVTGIPDPLLDRIPVALLMVDQDHEETVHRIFQTCREKLSPAKNPRRILVVPEIPKTPYGKHDRKNIRALAERLFSDKAAGFGS